MNLGRPAFFAAFIIACQTSRVMLSPRGAVLATSDSDPASCTALSSIYSSCEAATPGFSTLDQASIQPLCLCYSSSTLAPSIYDNAFLSCVSYYETSDPAVLTSNGILYFFTHTVAGRLWTTPCAEYAAYQSVLSINTDPRISACFSWGAIFTSCNQATPGFTSLDLSSKASCACYLDGGTTYAPSVYDGYLDTCLDYYSTYSLSYYSAIDGDHITRDPCSVVGNVKNGVTAAGTQASASSFPSTQMSATATEALTTSQPRATAAPNAAARGGNGRNDWSILRLLSLSVLLTLIFEI